MIKRTHLRHFIALVEAGGFTAAARRLNLAQPTLSTSIAELERLAGTPLILRERRSFRLTDAGHRLLLLARSVEAEFRTAETGLMPGRTPVRPLSLGVLPSLSTALVASLRAQFGDDRPLVLVEGTDADLRRRQGGRQIDAALTLLRHGETGAAVLEEPYALLLSDRHPLAKRSEVEAEELAGQTMVARRSCEILSETSNFFTARGVRPHFLMRSTNDDKCLALVREGFAITTGPASLAGNGIVAIPISGYIFRRRVGLIMPSGESFARLAFAWKEVARVFATTG